MNHKDVRILRDTLIIIGFIVMMAGYLFGLICTIIGAVIMLFCLIPDFLYNRCPHCKKRLGRNGGGFCQHCGESLD